MGVYGFNEDKTKADISSLISTGIKKCTKIKFISRSYFQGSFAQNIQYVDNTCDLYVLLLRRQVSDSEEGYQVEILGIISPDLSATYNQYKYVFRNVQYVSGTGLVVVEFRCEDMGSYLHLQKIEYLASNGSSYTGNSIWQYELYGIKLGTA